jgi:ATP-dependent RNA helicase DDX35
MVTYNRHAHYTLSQQRLALPIFQSRSEILFLLEVFRTVVIVGETGSGKTTQIPQYCHEVRICCSCLTLRNLLMPMQAGWTAQGFQVVCTQPRRIAAITGVLPVGGS